MTKEYLLKLTHFSEELAARRISLGLSRAEVAARSKMSLRSLANYESNKFEFKVRPKTIVLLSNALEQSPRVWLALLGYENITGDKLQEIGRSVGISITDSVDPIEYFEGIETRIRTKRALLCITFLSRIGLSQAKRIQSIISMLINECDFAVAIILPQSQNIEITKTSKTSMANYYRAIYNDAIEFTKDIILQTEATKRAKIGFFYPIQHKEEFFVPPHISHSFVRSTLLQISDTDESIYELGAWGTTRHNNKDNWFRMFPEPAGMTPHEAEDLIRYWKSYLQEIIEDWLSHKNGEDFGFWHREVIQVQKS